MFFEYYLNSLKLKYRKQEHNAKSKIQLKTFLKIFGMSLVVCVGLGLTISAIYGLVVVFISIGSIGTI